MQDLDDLAYFAEVVDRHGFASAARALGVPKSRLSRRVAELESRLGVRRLHRTTRRLSLTEAGETYFRHCVAMRDAALAASEAIAQVRSEPRGPLRTACPVSLAQSTLGLLVAGPGLLQRCGDPAEPDGLEAMPTVAMSVADGRANWQLVGPGGVAVEVVHRPVYAADDLQTPKVAALSGCGVALLPEVMVADELHSGALPHVLPQWAPVPAQVYAVFASRRGMVPAVRRLIDFLAERTVDADARWRNCEASGVEWPAAEYMLRAMADDTVRVT